MKSTTHKPVTRNTIQRDLVLEAVMTLRNHPTPEEVYEHIHKDHPTVSKGTVYRNLNFLVESGQLSKIPIPGAAHRVDHTLAPHYHIVCKQCGRVYDVDMPYQAELAGKIRDTGGFEIQEHEIVFWGTCPHCGKRQWPQTETAARQK